METQVLYDETRSVLYVMVAHRDEGSETMKIYWIFSKDSGQNFSTPLRISPREYNHPPMMHLNPQNGDLLFDWGMDPVKRVILYARFLDKLVFSTDVEKG